jgi:hypothetical protein
VVGFGTQGPAGDESGIAQFGFFNYKVAKHADQEAEVNSQADTIKVRAVAVYRCNELGRSVIA